MSRKLVSSAVLRLSGLAVGPTPMSRISIRPSSMDLVSITSTSRVTSPASAWYARSCSSTGPTSGRPSSPSAACPSSSAASVGRSCCQRGGPLVVRNTSSLVAGSTSASHP